MEYEDTAAHINFILVLTLDSLNVVCQNMSCPTRRVTFLNDNFGKCGCPIIITLLLLHLTINCHWLNAGSSSGKG